MGGLRNPERAAQVRVLSALARQHGLETLNDAAARAKVEKLSRDLLNLQLTDEVRQQVVGATAAFQATYPDAQPQAVQNPADNKVWKFSAVQLTYNCSQGEWASQEDDVLKRLFNRFVGFLIGWWLDNLMKAGKLTRATYLHLAARVTVGFQKRLADCKAAERYLQEESLRSDVSAQQHALAPAMLPMKVYPQVEEFIGLHDGQAKFRRPILAIVGGTRLGKSVFAGHVLRRVGERVNLADFLEITVEDSEQMDLAEFDRRIHAGVILDGVGDALFLKRHRETLQGRPKVVKGGKSATNVYAYSFSFCARAIVATFDLSARNLDLLETDHWLSNRENVILLKLTEPVYSTMRMDVGPFLFEDDDATPAASHRPAKRQWLGSPVRQGPLLPARNG
ncbi:unnamed protein product [Symbiodinium sp. CCMP2592]|nr:unnamed protein product [Symbiodinium sp. CCMP2592]